jgi:hypothetical protein
LSPWLLFICFADSIRGFKEQAHRPVVADVMGAAHIRKKIARDQTIRCHRMAAGTSNQENESMVIHPLYLDG